MTTAKQQIFAAVTFSLLSSSTLPVTAASNSPIWEQLSTPRSSSKAAKRTSAKKAKSALQKSKCKINNSLAKFNATTLAGVSTPDQIALFFGKGNSSSAPQPPSSALTIHPMKDTRNSENSTADVTEAQSKDYDKSPSLIAMDNGTANDAADLKNSAQDISSAAATAPPLKGKGSSEIPVSQAKRQSLIAQLAPDQLIADQIEATAATMPIPPVVSGTVDLEEFKPSNTIELKVSQSRTFKLRNKIIRTSISDPAIAEPVVVAENQVVLLGKTPGGTTLVMWDDAGNSVAIDVRVSRDYSGLQAMLREVDPRIILKPFNVGGTDRVVLTGDVDHPESIIRAFAIANAFLDDRNMNITVSNSRIMGTRPGEQGGASVAGGQQGQLSAISQVDRYTFFGNQTSNISKAQTIISDGGRVTSLVQVRKTPLIVLHTTFMEMSSSAVRELGLQLGIGFTSQSFGFALGGNPSSSANNSNYLTTQPGVNGTYGTMQNPKYGDTNTNLSGLANINGGGAAGINALQGLFSNVATQSVSNGVVTNTPAQPGYSFANIPSVITNNSVQGNMGTLVAPGKNPQFGASTAPVNFFGGGQANNYSNLGLGVINGLPNLLGGQSLFGSPGGATFQQGDLANMFQAVSNFASNSSSRWSVNPTVQGTIGYSRSRILAEPTLVTISGERAAFLAGGEIPILQSIATAGTAAQSIVFEPYGLRLNMIPVLLENGIINLQVAPEERLLDHSNAFTLPNQAAGGPPSSVPAFTTRKTQTTVELRPGQELFICGLVSQNSGRSLQKTPLMGEVPVLGALYRSKAFAKNETELIVSVRPEVILPGTPGQLKIPAELNKMEGVRDLNLLQIEPSTIDEGQYRSGLVEKTFQIPNTLPAGAPIPDSTK